MHRCEIIINFLNKAGGHLRLETIEDRAARLKRARNSEREREAFLRSNDAVVAANNEMNSVIQKFKELKDVIEDPSSQLYLGIKERPSPPMFQFNFDGYCLCFNNTSPFQIALYNNTYQLIGKLKVIIYETADEYSSNQNDNIHEQVEFKFDKDLAGNYGWVDYETGKNFITSDELINHWVKLYIDNIERLKKEQ